ncbi:hypothetical protein [Chromobacterium sp. CV08]|uniref:hypothetical protein n=1 Tax=Chromobacterium sp. CV08 TaxID=3133274 RepID=UPI003DA7D93F
MNKPHLSEAFKPEAVKQGAERSCPVAETACHPSTACLMAETCDCWRAEPAESADLQVEIAIWRQN